MGPRVRVGSIFLVSIGHSPGKKISDYAFLLLATCVAVVTVLGSCIVPSCQGGPLLALVSLLFAFAVDAFCDVLALFQFVA